MSEALQLCTANIVVKQRSPNTCSVAETSHGVMLGTHAIRCADAKGEIDEKEVTYRSAWLRNIGCSRDEVTTRLG